MKDSLSDNSQDSVVPESIKDYPEIKIHVIIAKTLAGRKRSRL